MKSLALVLFAWSSLTLLAIPPPMSRDPAPHLSATEAIKAASTASELKGHSYYCASAELEAASMAPDPRIAARHWRLVFFEAEHTRVVEAGGKQSFGDIEVRVSMDGNIFATRRLSFASAAPVK